MTASALNDVQLQKLEESCPLSTEAERKRFLKARDGDVEAAKEQLQNFLEWRASFELDLTPEITTEERRDDDRADWVYASFIAMSKALSDDKETRKSLRKRRSTQMVTLPQFVRIPADSSGNPLKGKAGCMLLHVMPAQVDKTLASAATYALTLALYLDRKFDRSTMDQGTMLIDVRQGEGWPNLKAHRRLSFIKTVSSTLEARFPERLNLCVIFPIPLLGFYVWKAAKPFLGRSISNNIQLIRGSAAVDAPLPIEDLSKHVDTAILKQLEADRSASFT